MWYSWQDDERKQILIINDDESRYTHWEYDNKYSRKWKENICLMKFDQDIFFAVRAAFINAAVDL